jgi:hypothetical protein
MEDPENLKSLKENLDDLGFSEKPNCYHCKFRRELGYSAHSKCVALTDKLEGDEKKEAETMISLLNSVGMVKSDAVKFNQHGVDNGWAIWPNNFDPNWLEKCEFFERK